MEEMPVAPVRRVNKLAVTAFVLAIVAVAVWIFAICVYYDALALVANGTDVNTQGGSALVVAFASTLGAVAVLSIAFIVLSFADIISLVGLALAAVAVKRRGQYPKLVVLAFVALALVAAVIVLSVLVFAGVFRL